jgi:hypothetical protein
MLVFLEPFCFGHFGDFIPKGENMGPKQVSGSNVGRGKLCANIGSEDQNLVLRWEFHTRTTLVAHLDSIF